MGGPFVRIHHPAFFQKPPRFVIPVDGGERRQHLLLLDFLSVSIFFFSFLQIFFFRKIGFWKKKQKKRTKMVAKKVGGPRRKRRTKEEMAIARAAALARKEARAAAALNRKKAKTAAAEKRRRKRGYELGLKGVGYLFGREERAVAKAANAIKKKERERAARVRAYKAEAKKERQKEPASIANVMMTWSLGQVPKTSGQLYTMQKLVMDKDLDLTPENYKGFADRYFQELQAAKVKQYGSATKLTETEKKLFQESFAKKYLAARRAAVKRTASKSPLPNKPLPIPPKKPRSSGRPKKKPIRMIEL